MVSPRRVGVAAKIFTQAWYCLTVEYQARMFHRNLEVPVSSDIIGGLIDDRQLGGIE